MEQLKGIDIGVYSSFRVFALKVPEVAEVMKGSAVAGGYLWIFFLAILVWRWRAILGRFPYLNLMKVLLLMAAMEALRVAIGRPRPDDAQEFIEPLFGPMTGGSFPNGTAFRAVLISALMWETSKPGWGKWLGLLGAVLYCVWVMMGQLMSHLAFLTDILASLFLALGIGFLSPRLFDGAE